jgi:hypothetical protein
MPSGSWPDFAELSMAISFCTHKRGNESLWVLNSGSGDRRNCRRTDKDN